MTPKERAAMQQALMYLDAIINGDDVKPYKLEGTALTLREALAEQAEQEPVAWFVQYQNRHEFVFGSKPDFIVDGVVEPLYSAPVRTKDLTDDEINKISHAIANAMPSGMTVEDWKRSFARAVIAADREKNK